MVSIAWTEWHLLHFLVSCHRKQGKASFGNDGFRQTKYHIHKLALTLTSIYHVLLVM